MLLFDKQTSLANGAFGRQDRHDSAGRILVRWEFYPKNFLGFVQLACLVILFKRF